MDITMIGLQNAGKTSLLRVLAVRHPPLTPNPYRANADSSATNRAVNSLLSMSHYRAIDLFGAVAGSCDTPHHTARWRMLADHPSPPTVPFQPLDLT
jgi:hypothetical protein